MKIKLNKKIIFIIVIIIVLGFIGYQFFIKNEKQEFVLEKVVKGTVLKEISETGTVKISQEANLGFKSTGKIERIYVEVGDMVKAGQLLVKLDTSELSIKLSEAKAALEVTQAKKTDAEVSLKNARQSLEDVKADAEEDLKNAYEDAMNTLDDAYLKLYNAYNIVDEIERDYFTLNNQEGVTVQEKVDKIKNALDGLKPYIDTAKSGSREDIDTALFQSKQALSDAKDSLEVVRNMTETVNYRESVSSTDKTSLDNQKSYINSVYTDVIDAQQAISTAKISNEANINDAEAEISTLETQLTEGGLYRAQINQAEANILLLENQIREVNLRSPADGQITKVEKRVGETVSGAETVISFLPSAPFQIEVDIYEEDIVNVRAGNPVEINLVAFPDEPLKGKVISVDPAEKLIEGVVYYEVTIDFEEIKEGIKSGMTADIVIETARKDNVLVIPEEAVKKINGKRIVQIRERDKIEEKEIKIGLEGKDYIEVVSGLKEGEEVIIR